MGPLLAKPEKKAKAPVKHTVTSKVHSFFSISTISFVLLLSSNWINFQQDKAVLDLKLSRDKLNKFQKKV